MGEVAEKKDLLVPSNIELFKISSWDGIAERCKLPEIKRVVEEQVQIYYTINVEDAMKKLTQVGKLLQLAYSGCKGFKSSTPVLDVLSRYQDLVKVSVITSSTFVEVVLKALSFHKLSLMVAEKNDIKKAFKMLEKCATLAERMGEESQKLVLKADELCKMSHKALLSANDDHNTSEEEKQKVINAAKKAEEDLAKLEETTNNLKEAVEEARREEEVQRKRAEGHEKTALITGLFILRPFTGNVCNKESEKASDARKKEEKATELRRNLQKEKREANAELARVVKQLQNSNTLKDELEKSIMSLEIAIKTLGQVKTVFLNAKQFWEGVKAQCLSLTGKLDEAKELVDFGDKLKDEFIEEVKKSGYCWLALGKINRSAALAMRSVDGKVDKIMTDLPTKEESVELIKDLTQEILFGIDADNKMIENESVEGNKKS